MKQPKHIVLSRKGFDSGTGCVPSPIFDDGSLLSLPIPDVAGTVRYDQLSSHGHSFGQLIKSLKAKRKSKKKGFSPLLPTDKAHLDPDLIPELRPRKIGWRPIFGQCGKDATILKNHNVGPGDLFLFFGWFKRCVVEGDDYSFISGSPDLHIVFGYLRVGEVIRPSQEHVPIWAMDHPHLHGTARKVDTNNTLFIATNKLGLPGVEELPGAFAFTRFTRDIQLTAIGKSRSWWKLPKWFQQRDGVFPLSSHENPDRWLKENDSCLLQSVHRGQEFVLDVAYFPESIEWVTQMINCGVQAGKEREFLNL